MAICTSCKFHGSKDELKAHSEANPNHNWVGESGDGY